MRTFVSGLPETACGYGSTLEATEAVRGGLRKMLDTLGVKSLLDAPCGDFNWMQEVDLSGIEYIGLDINPDHLAVARRRASHKFYEGTITVKNRIADKDEGLSERLKRIDAVLCRDFLQHLPTPIVVQSLHNFRRSGALWLIATCYENETNDDIAEAGEFRPLNLMKSPFDFPAPYLRIEENPTRPPHFLGAWRL